MPGYSQSETDGTSAPSGPAGGPSQGSLESKPTMFVITHKNSKTIPKYFLFVLENFESIGKDYM